jgi:hypothetical protein
VLGFAYLFTACDFDLSAAGTDIKETKPDTDSHVPSLTLALSHMGQAAPCRCPIWGTAYKSPATSPW